MPQSDNLKTIITLLYEYVSAHRGGTRWIVEHFSFEFPINHARIGEVWGTVSEEGPRVHIRVGILPYSQFGKYAPCVGLKLMEESGDPSTVLYHVSLPNAKNSQDNLFGIRTHFDVHPDETDIQRRYFPRFNTLFASITHYIEEFDGLLKRLLDECVETQTSDQ